MDKRQPSKLFKLKKWLSLPEAAKHLSGICGEEVTEADILQFSLDGYITLSVYFENPTYGQFGTVANYVHDDLYNSEPYWLELELNELSEAIESLRIERGKVPSPPMKKIRIFGHDIGNGNYLRFPDHSISEVIGVWDLAMVGGERLDVEQDLQFLKGWPSLVRGSVEGAFLVNGTGIMCQLQETYDNNPYKAGSIAELEDLKQLIVINGLSNEKAETLLNQHKENRKIYLENKASQPHKDDYFSTDCLPKDYVLVVRTESLRTFEQFLIDEETDNQSNSNRNTSGHEERHARNREQVFGAAFAVLGKWPDECNDTKGKPVASKIVRKIEAEADLFWPNGEPPLSTEIMADHLRDWIKKANNRK